MDFLVGIVIVLFSLFIGILPFFLLHVLADLLAFFLLRILKYRKEVVMVNLRESFPELDDKDLNAFVGRFYKNLADVILEGVKAFTMSSRQIIRRHRVINPERVIPFFEAGKSVIVCSGHCANWEWGSMSGAIHFKRPTVVMYKPLNNKWADKYLRWTRARFGSYLASIYKTAHVFNAYVPKATLFILAADQSPSNLRKAFWIDFLGQETAFLHGPEHYARKHDLPVFYVDIKRIKRGYYELEFELITEQPTTLEKGVLTQRYADMLARTIRRSPENWLWSHRRWKHAR
jgi:KDO2-lipid IV(A) lauroyltransferase